MDNPFQIITDTFSPQYRVNLSIQRLDGSIMLTLSNETGVVAKRMISAEQRNDPQRLKRLVQSIQFGIAIEQGHSAVQILELMTDGDSHKLLQRPPART
ncbi:DUF3509 domain-containing protein, partial [Pseudomonas lactis]